MKKHALPKTTLFENYLKKWFWRKNIILSKVPSVIQSSRTCSSAVNRQFLSTSKSTVIKSVVFDVRNRIDKRQGRGNRFQIANLPPTNRHTRSVLHFKHGIQTRLDYEGKSAFIRSLNSFSIIKNLIDFYPHKMARVIITCIRYVYS